MCALGKGASSEAAPAEVRSQLGLAIRELKGDLWRVAASLAPLLSMPDAAPLGQELSRRASRLLRSGECSKRNGASLHQSSAFVVSV